MLKENLLEVGMIKISNILWANIIGFVLVILGLLIALPFGHNSIMTIRDLIVNHAFQNPDMWRNLLITIGLFISMCGVIILSLQVKDYIIRISERGVYGIAYFYMIIPTIIFFLGYLKPLLGILFSFILFCGFCWHIKFNHANNKYFELPVKIIVLVSVVITLWVYISGVGVYIFEKDDEPMQISMGEKKRMIKDYSSLFDNEFVWR